MNGATLPFEYHLRTATHQMDAGMRVWRRLLKILAWLLGAAATLVVALYLVLLLINRHDRPPSEAALRLAAAYDNRPAIPDADNAYVYAMGFAVAPGDDPRAAGISRLEWSRTLAEPAAMQADDPFTALEDFRSSRSPQARQIAELCRSGSRECATALAAGDDAIRTWIASEQWLLDRYVSLLLHPGWLETVPFNERTSLPSYGTIIDGQQLLLAQAYLLAGQNDAAAVRELLRNDARFWRQVLRSSDILITKSMAAVALNRSFEIGNLIVRRLPAQSQMAALPDEWTVPLTGEERSMLRCLTGEWIFGGRILEQIGTASYLTMDDGIVDVILERALAPLFQPQDLRNRHAELIVRANAAMDVPLEQLSGGLDQARHILENPSAENDALDSLYNPVGDLLLTISAPAQAQYFSRVADVEGVRRATLLATEMRSLQIGLENVPAQLAEHEIRSPYDGQPFTWDAAEQAIVFVGKAPHERARHVIRY